MNIYLIVSLLYGMKTNECLQWHDILKGMNEHYCVWSNRMDEWEMKWHLFWEFFNCILFFRWFSFFSHQNWAPRINWLSSWTIPYQIISASWKYLRHYCGVLYLSRAIMIPSRMGKESQMENWMRSHFCCEIWC